MAAATAIAAEVVSGFLLVFVVFMILMGKLKNLL
jgi:hypothetical protein